MLRNCRHLKFLVEKRRAINFLLDNILKPFHLFSLRQEIGRMQKILSLVRETLTDLKLAIEGTIIMSENLKSSLDSMYDARWAELIRYYWAEPFFLFFDTIFLIYYQGSQQTGRRSRGCRPPWASGSRSCWRETGSSSAGVITADQRFYTGMLLRIWSLFYRHQGVLDHRLLQPPGLLHCDEAGGHQVTQGLGPGQRHLSGVKTENIFPSPNQELPKNHVWQHLKR